MLCISKTHLKALEAVSEKAWPLEACALLEGTRRRLSGNLVVNVTQIHFADNVADRPNIEFEVDPKVLFRVHRALRGAPTSLVGVWHSHPDGSETLSETDRERIRDPEYIWLLTPVVNSKATGTFGFEVKKDKDSMIFINLAVESHL